MPKLTKEQVLKKATEGGVELIDLQFTDYLGALKSCTIPLGQLADALENGKWFDGSSVEGFARIAESDMYLVPDPATYAVVPWRSCDGATARLICDVYSAEGEHFAGDPRYILKKAMAEAEEMGYICNCGPEYEFYMFPQDEKGRLELKSKGNGFYWTHAMDESYEIRKDIIAALEAFGIEVEASHYEAADRQHEIDFKYADALICADNALTLKYTVKNIANLYRYQATFMPKPIRGQAGSGMHTHFSLADKKTGQNLFYDDSDSYNLSPLAYQFMAGLMKYINEIVAVTNPIVNSYKRLTPGYEAPVYICWARKNRTALIRVPAIRGGATQATRFELRCPDPSNNPYLALAAMIKAGLQGVKEKMKVGKPVEEDVFEFDDTKLKKYYINSLPGSLRIAVELFDKSKIMKELFGEYTHGRYVATKMEEWEDYRLCVTPWEISRYLEDV
ncbi:MAG TPA: type I glutamate--ammonia ligase [Candidatus Wirthbacteria bacterium]|nr:type I glutamate--ammonia ligase [Candidatus Wirthbacteria bacterium]